jgi:hypothetical protein
MQGRFAKYLGLAPFKLAIVKHVAQKMSGTIRAA